MGLVDHKAKMAMSPASSSSPDSAIVAPSESSSPPSTAAPKKKRTFDIAFLTGQSETSDEGTSITRNDKFCPTSASLYAAPTRSTDNDSDPDDYRPNNRFTVLSQNSAAIFPKPEGGQPTNHVFSVCAGTNSSFEPINNGSCQDDKDSLVENGSKYKLFESFSGNNHTTNGIGSGSGYLVQNLWKDQNNADTHSSSSSNPKTSSKGSNRCKSKNGQTAPKSSKSSSQGGAAAALRSDSKKSNDLSPPLYSSPSELQLHFLHNHNQHHLKDESLSPERQSFANAQLRASHHDLVTSASFHPRNLTPSPFSSFLPQIGRFPIHLPSPLTGNGSNHQSSHNGSLSHSLSSQSPNTFSPPILSDKLTKEQHQQIISAYHQHQQQQNSMNKIRAAVANGFAPENLYPPYSPYPSAAAAALFLSQSTSNSSMGNLGLMNPNSSPPTSMPSFQHNGNGNSNSIVGSNGQGQGPTLSPTGNPMTTATLLPPSLTSLTLPAQNVCAKCNIGFRMTSDLVYHMRSHHKREADPMKKKREDKLKCNVCFETFRERHHLTRHMTAHQDRAEELLHDAATAAAALERESKPMISNHCA